MRNETLLYRQIHPSFIHQGRVTSQAFRPTPKDEQKLSVYDGDLITAPKSYEHYTETLRLQSCGVLGVLYEDCQLLDLPVTADSQYFIEHALIDFSKFDRKETERKASSWILLLLL
jgi:hypothetical protein